MRVLAVVVIALFTSLISSSQTYTISTFAGNGVNGFSGDNGPATSASLSAPAGVALDAAGNLYIADMGNNCIREISNGVVTTIAGNGTYGFSGDGGPALGAELGHIQGLAIDRFDNLYIADNWSNRIRKVSNGVISTVAGNGIAGFGGDNGPAVSAQLNFPTGVAVDAAGNLYIADAGNYRIRKVSSGVITTIAGNGTHGFIGDGGSPLTAELFTPEGVAVDSAGNLYIADTQNNRIREVSDNIITTVAGNGTLGFDGKNGFSGDNGPAVSASLLSPNGVAVDTAGNLYIADTGNNRIRKVTNGIITTVAGNGIQGFGGDGGSSLDAELSSPQNTTVDNAENLYIADTGNNRIRAVVAHSAAPSIGQNGIVPIYSSTPAIQPGSWVSIFGTNLASNTAVWNGEFPESLGGTSVTINNKPAYLWSVNSTQINLQAPDDTSTGTVPVVVTTANGTSISTVTLGQFGPSFCLLNSKYASAIVVTPGNPGNSGAGYDIIGPPGAFSYPTRPVKAGEVVSLYGVGFGPTNPTVPAGQAFSGAAPSNTLPVVTIGGVTATVIFAGIVEAGLFQFNVVVPNAGSGDQLLRATVAGVITPNNIFLTLE